MYNRYFSKSRYRKNRGYGLLQSSFALVVMATLIAVVIPQMLELIEDARDAKVKAVTSGFKAAVYLARESWYAAGKPRGALDNFGEGNMLMSSTGWPVAVADADNHEQSLVITDRHCRDIWKALLIKGAPEVGVAEQLEENTQKFDASQYEIEFLAYAKSDQCHYRYLEGNGERLIQYNPASGRIISKIR